MGRRRTARGGLITTVLSVVLLLLPGRGAGVDAPLKLLISVEQQAIPAPFPARLTLHLHNAGSETVWLYRHAQAKLPSPRMLEEDTSAPTTGGSVLTVKIEPAGAAPANISKPAQGVVFESVGPPKPKLVPLAPGGDYEETASIQLSPAVSELQAPIWGTYRVSVVYAAQFSNAEEILRSLKVALWQGEVSSNTIEVQLQPPGPGSRGEVSGTVDTPSSVPIRDAVVSLTDKTERLVDQMKSDPDGRYWFSHLPPGLYWVTARRAGATDNTVVFRHVELTPSEPSATQQLVLVPQDIWEPKQVVHKPVLFRVTDSAGGPMDRVVLEIVFSNGDVVDNVKGETGTDGTAALELIPGRNFVTLKYHGCPKQDERADVSAGGGIEGFGYTLQCSKK